MREFLTEETARHYNADPQARRAVRLWLAGQALAGIAREILSPESAPAVAREAVILADAVLAALAEAGDAPDAGMTAEEWDALVASG